MEAAKAFSVGSGGIFAFSVAFHGSLGAAPPPGPVVAVALAR